MIKISYAGEKCWSEVTACSNARKILRRWGRRQKKNCKEVGAIYNMKSEIEIMVNTETALQALMGFRKVTVEFLKALIPKGTERADAICTVCYVKERGPPII